MNGRLVSNTGPLIALGIIDRLDILRVLFQEVSIPDAVHRELLEGGDTLAGLDAYLKASWIRVRSLSAPVDPLLGSVLDIGEASVIQLARESGADFALIDERKGRKVARHVYGMNVIGSARILVEAKKKGLVQSVRDAMDTMRANGYRLHCHNDRRRFFFPLLSHPQYTAKVMHDCIEHSGFKPPAALLINGVPGGKIMGHHPPLGF